MGFFFLSYWQDRLFCTQVRLTTHVLPVISLEKKALGGRLTGLHPSKACALGSHLTCLYGSINPNTWYTKLHEHDFQASYNLGTEVTRFGMSQVFSLYFVLWLFHNIQMAFQSYYCFPFSENQIPFQAHLIAIHSYDL